MEIFGDLRDQQGVPLAGERVHLQSQLQNTHYQAVSGPDGSFSFSEVSASSDYRLRVRPKGRYTDYSWKPVDLNADTPPLAVVLEALSAGRLTGRMVDAEGNPVPQFSLWLRSAQARGKWLKVTGDAYGYFKVDEVPEGLLIFQTRSLPQFRISGIPLDAESERYVELVLDWGEAVLEGRVVNAHGNPLAGAQVNLSWLHGEGPVRSRSARKTVTDSRGWFTFSRLGPGPRHLNVSAAGHSRKQRALEPGEQWVEVQLESLEQ